MMAAFTAPDVHHAIIELAALIMAIGVIVVSMKSIYRIAKHIEMTFELVNHELKSNAGSSIRDAIDRLERTGVELTNEMKLLSDRVQKIERGES